MHITQDVSNLIQVALDEDIPTYDVTTRGLFPQSSLGTARIVSKENGVLAGMSVAFNVCKLVDPKLEYMFVKNDGDNIGPSFTDGDFDNIAVIKGSINSMMLAERTILNFLQHLSGVATLTRNYVDAVEGTGVTIVDTRKTIPGMRRLEKEAVRIGGGKNLRMSLSDGILIKDNHIRAAKNIELDLVSIVKTLRNNMSHTLKIEIEVTNLEEVELAIIAKADGVLLDNMDIETTKKAVSLCKGKVFTEASGNMDLEKVRRVAETGVDLISVGALTHSVRALDLSFKLI